MKYALRGAVLWILLPCSIGALSLAHEHEWIQAIVEFLVGVFVSILAYVTFLPEKKKKRKDEKDCV